MVDSFVSFGDLLGVPLRNGVSYSSKLRGSGVSMVNMREIFATDRIGDDDFERAPISESERDRFLLEVDDLLFARQSLTYEGAGKCSIVVSATEERTWESHLIRARLDRSRAQPSYYYYYFRSPAGRRNIETIVQQVAAAGIRGSDLARLKVPVPPLSVQQSVAEVLGALDDKIAANDRVLVSTRSLLAACFERLGVDAGDDETLDGLVDINPPTTAPDSGRVPYLDMKTLPDRAMTAAGAGRRLAQGGARFVNGDTLLARITPCLENGKLGYIDFLSDGETGVGSTEFIVLRAKLGTPSTFGYFLAASDRFRDYAIRHMAGTSGRQRLTAPDVARYGLRRPTDSGLALFSAASNAVMPRVSAAVAESQQLVVTRDELLPVLMSGALRVKDAEKVVEKVV